MLTALRSRGAASWERRRVVSVWLVHVVEPKQCKTSVGVLQRAGRRADSLFSGWQECLRVLYNRAEPCHALLQLADRAKRSPPHLYFQRTDSPIHGFPGAAVCANSAALFQSAATSQE